MGSTGTGLGGAPPAYTFDNLDENYLDAQMDDDYDERRSPRRPPTRDSTNIPSLQSKSSDQRAVFHGDNSGTSNATSVHAVSVGGLDGVSGRGRKGRRKERSGGDRGGGGNVDDETRELER